MNNRITFPKLASLLADKSGRSKRFSEDFLREFFALISEQLEAGENVKVKGLGTFRLLRVEARKSVDVTTGQPMEISGHSKVVFTPAKELAEAVNAPFEAFSPIEIGDSVELDKLTDDDIDVEIKEDPEEIELSFNNEMSSKTSVAEYPFKTESQEVYVPAQEHDVTGVRNDPQKNDNPNDKDVPTIIGDALSSRFDDGLENIKVEKRGNRLKKLLVCLGCAVLAVALILIWPLLFKPDLDSTDTYKSELTADHNKYGNAHVASEIEEPGQSLGNSVEAADYDSGEIDTNLDDVPTAPSDAVVYDTIGKTRYLTTMAKDHYGSNKFWPYIYEENKNNIGHPDRIRPGTPIVIPKLSKYGVDPSNPKDVEKANKLGVEIYARYGKTL